MVDGYERMIRRLRFLMLLLLFASIFPLAAFAQTVTLTDSTV